MQKTAIAALLNAAFSAGRRLSVNRFDDKKDNVIQVTIHIINQIIMLYKASENLNKELGREPSDDEIAKNLTRPIKRVLGIKKSLLI